MAVSDEASTGTRTRRVPQMISMWSNPRMVMLAALSAAIYVAVLLPFKGIQIIPGFAEARPGAVMPVVLALLFGPAGAWGGGIGNLIADFFGTLSLGSFFGFWGNVLLGYVPYKLWGRLGLLSSDNDLSLPSGKAVGQLLVVCALGVLAKGLFIGYGVDLLGLVPYAAFAGTIPFSNGIAVLILTPILIKLLYPRVSKMGLVWHDVMDNELRGKPLAPKLQTVLLVVGALGYFFGFVLVFASGNPDSASLPTLAIGLAPFTLALLVAPFMD